MSDGPTPGATPPSQDPAPGADAGAPTPPHPPERGESFIADTFQTRYREVTISALVFAVMIGVVMNAAITYAGLKIGFTIVGSAIAAVLGFGVLRGLVARILPGRGVGSIVETNIAQTVASAVNTSNSGVIFTVPVLFLLGYRLTFGSADFWLVTLACIAGAVLGCAFIVPLRKQMIDIERLRFPSAVGVAMILRSPGAGSAKAVVLIAGILLGALIYLPAGLPGLPSGKADATDFAAMVDGEHLTPHDARRLRAIDGWIAAGEAPSVIWDAGAVASQLEAVQTQRDDETETEGATPLDLALIDTNIERLEEELERQLDLAAEPDGANAPGLTADLVLAVRALTQAGDDADWESLRDDPSVGWPDTPRPGYGSLGLRLSAEVATGDDGAPIDATAFDRDADGVKESPQLTIRVDRDQNGVPDRIVDGDTIDLGRALGLPDQFQLIFAIAPFALGAGYITGRAGLFVLAGGILAFFVINPVGYAMNWVPATLEAHQAPGFLFGAVNRPLGIGLLLGGAMMGVAASLPAIREAIKSIAAAGGVKGGGDELGIKTLAVAVVLGMVFLFTATAFIGSRPFNTVCPVTEQSVLSTTNDDGETITPDLREVRYAGYTIALVGDEALATWNDWDDAKRDEILASKNAKPGLLSGLPPLLRSGIIALIGGLWIWFAGIIIAQCTGMTDWSPISGLALLTVVLVMVLARTRGDIVAAVMLGLGVCASPSPCAADMMADLEDGLSRRRDTEETADGRADRHRS